MIVRRPRVRGFAGFPGLGLDYNDLLAQAGLQNCDPRDSACVSGNVAKQAAVEDLWVNKYMTQAGGAPAGTQLTFTPQTQAQVGEFYSSNPAVGGNVVDTRGILNVNGRPPVQPSNDPGSGYPQGFAPRLTFASSRGGTSLLPGDTWTVSITGARPTSTVYVQGGKGGDQSTTRMGVTDSSGNFSVSGTITPDQVGSWSEAWSAGGAVAGSFSFTVAAPTTPSGATIIKSSGTQNAPADSSSGQTGETGATFSFSAFPWWVWAAGGGLALFAMKGGRR